MTPPSTTDLSLPGLSVAATHAWARVPSSLAAERLELLVPPASPLRAHVFRVDGDPRWGWSVSTLRPSPFDASGSSPSLAEAQADAALAAARLAAALGPQG